jgi:hypothetical protein
MLPGVSQENPTGNQPIDGRFQAVIPIAIGPEPFALEYLGGQNHRVFKSRQPSGLGEGGMVGIGHPIFVFLGAEFLFG